MTVSLNRNRRVLWQVHVPLDVSLQANGFVLSCFLYAVVHKINTGCRVLRRCDIFRGKKTIFGEGFAWIGRICLCHFDGTARYFVILVDLDFDMSTTPISHRYVVLYMFSYIKCNIISNVLFNWLSMMV